MTGRRNRRVGTWVVLLAAAGLGSGCAFSSTKTNTPPGGSGSGGSSGSGGQGGGVIPACQVKITAQSPASFTGLTAGPGSKLRVRGEVTGLPGASYSWAWGVAFADGTTVAHLQPPSTDPSIIEFPLALPGTYTITAELAGNVRFCGGEETVIVPRAGAKLTSFRFRFVPPADSDPPQERELQVIGGTPSGGNRLALLQGTLVPFAPRDAVTGAAIPAYVRVTDAARRTVAEAHVGADGQPANLRLMAGPLDLLVIPDGDYAPVLLAGKQAPELAAMPMSLDKGITLSGQLTDAAGPVAGAKVVLRAGTLPSTLGVTGPTGAFTVRAMAGTYGLHVTRADGAGNTLEMTLPPAPGIAVSGGNAMPALDVKMAAYATTPLSLNLLAGDGGALAAPARVLIETTAPVEGLVSVTLGATMRSAGLKVRREFTQGATAVPLAGLPRARYQATVIPGTSTTTATAMAAGSDAVTAVSDLDLTAGNPVVRSLTLKRKVTLSGKLLPGAQAGGVPVTAVDLLGDFPIAVPGSANEAGAWSLLVNPERSYSLRALPQPGRMLARTIFGPVVVRATDLSVADQRMPPALLFAGTLVDHSLQGIDGGLIQVYCLASSPDCADTETPVAEAVTLSDGSFQLLLPDPGVN